MPIPNSHGDDWAMQGSTSDMEVETALAVKLNYDKFDLVKQLVKNRLKIVWCTRLERADTDDERKRLQVNLITSR